MKRILNIFLLLVLLTSVQRTSRSSGQSANEGAKQSTAAIVYSQSPDANDLFLRAREYLKKSNPRIGGLLANTREAIRLFEQAVEKDPKFAAYISISSTIGERQSASTSVFFDSLQTMHLLTAATQLISVRWDVLLKRSPKPSGRKS